MFNLYRAPIIAPIAGNADRWLHHVEKLYGDDAAHIIRWCAHRVQRPAEKINHALVLGGKQGIGKDTLLEPVKYAIGAWNFLEVSPQQVLGRFNGFLKSVILRVSEARDLGEFDRFAFYDHMKAVTAAPPDVLRIDEKNRDEYAIPNVGGVIITTNHKADGIYLPADDRRHFVAWSDLDKSDFTAEYWNELWHWYDNGGCQVVAHYLLNLDLSAFNPKAPPPQTDAFLEIVNASRSPEDAELADALDAHCRSNGLPRMAGRRHTSRTSWQWPRNPTSSTISRTARTAAGSRTASKPAAIRRCATPTPTTACGPSKAAARSSMPAQTSAPKPGTVPPLSAPASDRGMRWMM